MIETIQWIFEKNINFIWLVLGILFILGTVQNWDWLCNPQGTPSWWPPKELRRPFFFLIGIILIVCGI